MAKGCHFETFRGNVNKYGEADLPMKNDKPRVWRGFHEKVVSDPVRIQRGGRMYLIVIYLEGRKDLN